MKMFPSNTVDFVVRLGSTAAAAFVCAETSASTRDNYLSTCAVQTFSLTVVNSPNTTKRETMLTSLVETPGR